MTDRALVFTDVVDSTRFVANAGDARAAAVWAEHDRRSRELLARHRGLEIDRSDGFFLVFESVLDAAGFAVGYHEAMAALGLGARIGLHVGPAVLRDNAEADVARGAKPVEVDGLAKSLAARVMALAAPGRTLLSGPARAALGAAGEAAAPPAGCEIRGHGHYRLKGVDEPLEVFELGRPGETPFLPPQDVEKAWRVWRDGDLWRPVRAVRHNLPAERDAFVGRNAELRSLGREIDAGGRLRSIVGPAGAGKTRLARRYASHTLGGWPGGVWFCDLSEARDLGAIERAVASALDVPLGAGDTGAQLGDAIAGRGRCLLVFDNFEQVAAHAAATLGRWLDHAAQAVFLVTSRERLYLPGEHMLLLEPLPLGREAIELFELRARAHKPDFVLDDANREAVGELVRLLDGLPLAIELAAARSRVLSPAQLALRMRDRFRLLQAPGVDARRSALKVAIDWSWDLLTPWEQAAAAQCSTFEGGFTIDAAEAVVDLGAWPEAPPVLDAVQSLVDKSLLRTWRPPGAERYDFDEPYFGMYISIHDYAAGKLQEAGPAPRVEAERRHGGHFAGLGSDASLEQLFGHGGERVRRRLQAEIDNLIVACRRAAARGDGAVAVAAFRALWEVLELQGPCALGVELGDLVLATPGLDDRGRAAAGIARALAARRIGRNDDAGRRLQAALDAARRAGDERLEAIATGHVGVLHYRQGQVEQALGLFERALAAHRAQGRRRHEALMLGSLGTLHVEQGRMEAARADYEAALALHRTLGNRDVEGLVLANLGTLEEDQGRLEAARRCYDEALAIHREVGNRQAEGLTLGNLAGLLATLGDRAAARAAYESALSLQRETGNRQNDSAVLAQLAAIDQADGRRIEAEARLREALAIARETHDRRSEAFALGHLADLLAETGRDADAVASFAQGEAIFRELGEQTQLGRLLCAKGRCDLAAGRLAAARAALAEAEAIAAAVEANADSDLGGLVARLREAIGADRVLHSSDPSPALPPSR